MTSEEESTEEGDGTDALNFGADVDDGVVGITPAQSRAAASAAAQSRAAAAAPHAGDDDDEDFAPTTTNTTVSGLEKVRCALPCRRSLKGRLQAEARLRRADVPFPMQTVATIEVVYNSVWAGSLSRFNLGTAA